MMYIYVYWMRILNWIFVYWIGLIIICDVYIWDICENIMNWKVLSLLFGYGKKNCNWV